MANFRLKGRNLQKKEVKKVKKTFTDEEKEVISFIKAYLSTYRETAEKQYKKKKDRLEFCSTYPYKATAVLQDGEILLVISKKKEEDLDYDVMKGEEFSLDKVPEIIRTRILPGDDLSQGTAKKQALEDLRRDVSEIA